MEMESKKWRRRSNFGAPKQHPTGPLRLRLLLLRGLAWGGRHWRTQQNTGASSNKQQTNTKHVSLTSHHLPHLPPPPPRRRRRTPRCSSNASSLARSRSTGWTEANQHTDWASSTQHLYPRRCRGRRCRRCLSSRLLQYYWQSPPVQAAQDQGEGRRPDVRCRGGRPRAKTATALCALWWPCGAKPWKTTPSATASSCSLCWSR